MPSCQFIKRPHRKVCIGDVDTLITLQNRNIVAPVFGDVDFDEDFQDASEVWAKIETNIGDTVFDGVSTDINITHKITIRFDVTVTTETWIEIDVRKFDIMMTENFEERNEWLLMFCTIRGIGESAKA